MTGLTARRGCGGRKRRVACAPAVTVFRGPSLRDRPSQVRPSRSWACSRAGRVSIQSARTTENPALS